MISYYFLVILFYTQAFASMPQLILRDISAVMYFAVVEKAGTIVLKDKEKVRLIIFINDSRSLLI